MRKVIIFTIAAASILLAASSCKEPEPIVIPVPPVVTLTVSDITTNSVTVSVATEGDEPGMVRVTSVVPAAEFTENVDVNDAESIASWAKAKGSSINVPNTKTYSDLEPFTEYAVAVVCYDADMNYSSSDYKLFRTATVDNALSEDGNGAGSLIER